MGLLFPIVGNALRLIILFILVFVDSNRMNGGEKRYPDEAFIQAIKEHSPASTSEVAESVGCTRRNADIRLKKLAGEGSVRQKKIAASQVWVVAENQ